MVEIEPIYSDPHILRQWHLFLGFDVRMSDPILHFRFASQSIALKRTAPPRYHIHARITIKLVTASHEDMERFLLVLHQ